MDSKAALCFLVVFAVSINFMTPAEAWSCPEYNTDLWGADLDYIGQTTSWQACGELCAQNPSCSVWSWYIKEQTCITKLYFDGSSDDSNAISGVKSCNS